MTFEPEPPPAAAPKWARMPGPVRVKLDHAIADHLRTHGARHYDLLREDPAFALWIGAHLGARGEKRLDRAIAEVRRFQKKKLARSAASTAPAAVASPDLAAPAPTDDPVQQFTAAGSAVISYTELQAELRRRRAQLEAAMEGCLNEDGEAVRPELFVTLSREHRALVADSAKLAKGFHADFNSQAALERLMQRLLRDHADDPQSARTLIADINNIIHGTSGIAATGDDA